MVGPTNTMCYFCFCFCFCFCLFCLGFFFFGGVGYILHCSVEKVSNGTSVLSTVFLMWTMGWSRSTRSPAKRQNRTHSLSRSSGRWEQDFSSCDVEHVYSGIGWGASQSKLGPSEPETIAVIGTDGSFDEDKLGSARSDVRGLHAVSGRRCLEC